MEVFSYQFSETGALKLKTENLSLKTDKKLLKI